MSRVVVAIPALNEQGAIRDVVTGVLATGLPVIVINDGSTDDTAKIAAELPVTVITHPQRQGKGQSLRDALAEARKLGHTAVVSMDGDGQHHAEDLGPLLRAHAAFPDVMLRCAREIGRGAPSWIRRFANHFADFWISWACGQKVLDSQCGHRLYPLAMVAAMNLPQSEGFAFESEMLIEAARIGTPIGSIAIKARYHAGRRASHFQPILDALRITRMISWRIIKRGFYLPGLYRSLTRSPLRCSP
ncbi:MAG: glycosyltransferase family 2 protein [Ahniella sp.]|nr:glycosyltransferase family 2 protein [Ahniella sp.]